VGTGRQALRIDAAPLHLTLKASPARADPWRCAEALLTATILVVDDEPYVRRSVGRILERAQYDVILAEDVRQAIGYAERIPMDAAIVDFDLPDADGLQVLSRLRDLQPSCLRILMTALQDHQLYIDAVNRGEVLRVLPKPTDPVQLLQTVQDAFQAARRMARVATAQREAVSFQEHQMLQECFDNDLLRLALQPIIDPRDSSRPAAYEALLRSLHPQLDGPLAVLRVAERHKRLCDLGARVFELAAERLTHLPLEAGLFVNLAAEQLTDPQRLRADIAVLVPHAHRITVEITEQSHLASIANWDDSIGMLRELGFALAVDDLGAGYNSLSVLAQLQPQVIKLDMSLVRDVHINGFSRRVIELVANLAEATDARVVAEGVECAEEADALVDCGCHLLQGYYFGRPTLTLPSEKTEAA